MHARAYLTYAVTTVTAAVLAVSPTAAVARVTTGIDAEAELPYWELVEGDLSLRLVQRLPDQTRGFYQARGFAVADAERIAQSCMFQTIFRNVAPPANTDALKYNLKEWVVYAAGTQRRMKTREDWAKEWARERDGRRVPQSARLAFEWGLLPTRQSYRPGDYNWGLSVFNLAPDTPFDVDVVWHEGNTRRQARIEKLRCAPDTPVAPRAEGK